jgi:hypothetical protein
MNFLSRPENYGNVKHARAFMSREKKKKFLIGGNVLRHEDANHFVRSGTQVRVKLFEFDVKVI